MFQNRDSELVQFTRMIPSNSNLYVPDGKSYSFTVKFNVYFEVVA